jgi:hypothetical protein
VKWLAILLALAGLGGTPTRDAGHGKKCSTTKSAKHKACKKPKKPATKPKQPATKPKQPATKQPGGETPTTPGAPRNDEPGATPTPTPTPTASPKPGQPAPTPTATSSPAPTPTATPVYPRRTAVDLVEWDIRSSYLTLAAGRVTFNANNLGEDDHNLSIRGGGHEYGKVDLAPGDTTPLALDLPAGTYTLYCSLLGHEEAGMKLAITIR